VNPVILSQLPPTTSILAGATLGERHAEIITGIAAALNHAAVRVVLDFQGAESVTASYLKALFKAFAAGSDSKVQLYPLVANVGASDLRYELESYLNGRDFAVQQVTVSDGIIRPTETIGRLDLSAAEAYRELNTMGTSTAAVLHERNPSAASSQTAWNNRLVKLFELRLAHRTRVGRHWVYQSAFNL
jgi:hypothetical protein